MVAHPPGGQRPARGEGGALLSPETLRALYLANVTAHVLAAFLWLGGMLFLAAVGAPRGWRA